MLLSWHRKGKRKSTQKDFSMMDEGFDSFSSEVGKHSMSGRGELQVFSQENSNVSYTKFSCYQTLQQGEPKNGLLKDLCCSDYCGLEKEKMKSISMGVGNRPGHVFKDPMSTFTVILVCLLLP